MIKKIPDKCVINKSSRGKMELSIDREEKEMNSEFLIDKYI